MPVYRTLNYSSRYSTDEEKAPEDDRPESVKQKEIGCGCGCVFLVGVIFWLVVVVLLI